MSETREAAPDVACSAPLGRVDAALRLLESQQAVAAVLRDLHAELLEERAALARANDNLVRWSDRALVAEAVVVRLRAEIAALRAEPL